MIKKITLTAILISISSFAISQTSSLAAYTPIKQEQKSKLRSNKTYQILETPIILIGTGLAYKTFDGKFNTMRNSYTPTFKHHYDDYTQYLPAAVMLGLKLGKAHDGGATPWGEMLAADGFSIIIMTGLVNSIKHTAKVQRPANGSYNSFPSGHTATAFMTASMLHKEFGHISPWYSIGAYTVATATGVTRILNNRHWVSDVFAGAAIGIVSVELGYLISDRIFNKNRDPHTIFNLPSFGHDSKPSFVGLYTGVNLSLGEYAFGNGSTATVESGSRAGVEGAWFITPYLGVGGLATVSTSFVNSDSQPSQHLLNTLSASAGLYLSYPITSFIRLGTKALVGTNYMHKNSTLPANMRAKEYRLNLQTGASVAYLAKENLAFKLFVDYNYSPQFIGGKAANDLAFGVSIDLMH